MASGTRRHTRSGATDPIHRCSAHAALFGAAVALGVAYHRLGRPRMLRWGISDQEAGQWLPGDERVPDPARGNNSTHAITIDAPPSAVWPWIVQIGHGRAGWYSHDWLERLFGIRYAEGHSATRIHSEFQGLQVGDEIPYSPFNAIRVVAIDPERSLVIGNSVAWVVQDLGDGRTRLVVRTRGYGWFRSLLRPVPVLRELGAVIDYVIGEPLHHYMEKGMCVGITRRVEGRGLVNDRAGARAYRPAHGAVTTDARQPLTPRSCRSVVQLFRRRIAHRAVEGRRRRGAAPGTGGLRREHDDGQLSSRGRSSTRERIR
ncbi:MAG TPA: hypothetical protein VMU39_15585 [Solirubrobacteraceae bacterium]|nr:hypothetical protein [Solirubrobacteraceae bacterium]